MQILKTVAFVAAAALAWPVAASAQQSGPDSRVSVSFGGGAASTSSATRMTFAGAVNFEISDRASIEAETRYLDRGPGAGGLAATGTFLVNLTKPHNRVVPFVMVGGGMYRASFDMNNRRFMGDARSQFSAGSMLCPGTGSGFQHMPGSGMNHGNMQPLANCPSNASGMWGLGQMPMFYAGRMGAMRVPQSGMWQHRSFTDPAMTIGGGVRLRNIGHLTLRADAKALVLFSGGDTHTLGVFGLTVGYRF